MKIIGFSGPPRSGKDTLGDSLAAWIEDHMTELLDVPVRALSQPMRESAYGLLGVPYSLAHYEANKDTPQPMFGNNSIRQVMIALSEGHVKPTYGHDFWARALINRLELEKRVHDRSVLVVTDMGFDAEAEFFEREFGVENCVWVHLYREGKDFAGDSRSYVGSSDRVVVVQNEEGQNAIYDTIKHLYGQLIGRFQWEI